MSMYGKDSEYANSRLCETIVRRGDAPVYVHSVGRNMEVTYSFLGGLDQSHVCDLDELDLHPVPLGYCNYNKYASYLTRIPMRKDWRQGLRRGNYTTINAPISADRIPYDALEQVIKGDYPTYAAALDAVRKVKSMAWHRHWAVNNGLEVFYKGSPNPVGNVEEGKVILTSRNSYLIEALGEAV